MEIHTLTPSQLPRLDTGRAAVVTNRHLYRMPSSDILLMSWVSAAFYVAAEEELYIWSSV